MVADIRIKIKNVDEIRRYLKERPSQTKRALNEAVEKSVLLIVRGTKQRSPVKTGLMRARVDKILHKRIIEGEVFVGVRYAIYVHEGTRFMQGRPFMGDAIRASSNRIQGFFVQALKEALK